MTVKTSISLADAQAEFAKTLVEQGAFPSVSAVAQHGIELIRQRQDAERTDTEALKTLLSLRADGEFLSGDDFRSRVKRNLSQKRRAYDLED